MYKPLVELIGEIETNTENNQDLVKRLRDFVDCVLMIDINIIRDLFIKFSLLKDLKEIQYFEKLNTYLYANFLEAAKLSVLQADFEELLSSANTLSHLLSDNKIKESEKCQNLGLYITDLKSSIILRINEYFLSNSEFKLDINFREKIENLKLLLEISDNESQENWFQIGLNRFVKKLKKKHYGDSYANTTDQVKIYSPDASNRSFVIEFIKYFESKLN